VQHAARTLLLQILGVLLVGIVELFQFLFCVEVIEVEARRKRAESIQGTYVTYVSGIVCHF
jgi:hypothetical protein